MDVFWGVLFGGIAAIVLVWLIARVLVEGKGGELQEFTGSEPSRMPEELADHQERWDRSKEEGDPL